jgi:hypothetical protein
MKETILSKLEASRKELLDLGLRNSLLNYNVPASRGVHVIQERSSSVYNILVTEGKTMSFIAKSTKEPDNLELDFANDLEETNLKIPLMIPRLQTNVRPR